MASDLEYEIRAISTESPFHSLELQEFDRDQKQVGLNYIPWSHSLNFNVTELKVSSGLEFGEINNTISWCRTVGKEFTPPVECKSSERIFGKLAPIRSTFSFFGTGRVIKQFSVIISCTEQESEYCFLGGGLRIEGDFFMPTQEDWLEFSIGLQRSRYDQLVNQIRRNEVDSASIHVCDVQGMYAWDGPEHVPDDVKVLGRHTDQEVTASSDISDLAPRLEDMPVPYFSLRMESQSKLAPEDTAAEENSEILQALFNIQRLQEKNTFSVQATIVIVALIAFSWLRYGN